MSVPRFATALKMGMPIIFLLVAGFRAAAYQESPILAKRVETGELPQVEDRLPPEPVVVEPVRTIGKYGGTWRRLYAEQGDTCLDHRLGYESLVRWDRTGKRIVPGIAKSWDVLEGGRRYVFHLRRGIRWSDGHPFTSEDLRFYYEDVYSNTDLWPVFISFFKSGGTPATVSAPDPYTFEFHFTEPYGIFLEFLAYEGHRMLRPKHYLEQFHQKYTEKDALDKRVREMGFLGWSELFSQVITQPEKNPDLPMLNAFVIKVPPPAGRMLAVRNPYYWKVDPEGNQLPYIDEIAYISVQDYEILTMKAISGAVDFQARGINSNNYPLFMRYGEASKYHVLADPKPGSVVLIVNQYSNDPEIRPILQDRRFRIALSAAINREELIFLMCSNLAEPSTGIASPYDPYWLPEFNEKYLEYDPELANRLLDEVGLKRGRDGIRRLPNGKPFRRVLNAQPGDPAVGTMPEFWELLMDYFREVGLDFSMKILSPEAAHRQATTGAYDFWGWGSVGMHWVAFPAGYVPYSGNSYFGSRYGLFVSSDGKDNRGVMPPPEMQRMLDWYRELRGAVGDEDRKLELGHKILRQWSEECYMIGICRQRQLMVVSDRFKNVPDRIIHDWLIKTPGYIGIEQFYIDEEGVP
jgi:peptide/nickel transport system substrate-binding protein